MLLSNRFQSHPFKCSSFPSFEPHPFFWGVPIARSQGRLLRKAKSAPLKIYHQDMSSSHDKFLKILHLSFLLLAFSTNFVLLTQNVNVARFARNLECKFFYDFQTMHVVRKSTSCIFSMKFGMGRMMSKLFKLMFEHHLSNFSSS